MRTIKRKATAALLAALIIVGGCAARTAQQKAAGSDEAGGTAYVIKAYHDRVAVFEKGNGRPEEILDCPLDSLPQDVVQKLEQGITAADEKELQRLIEAFD